MSYPENDQVQNQKSEEQNTSTSGGYQTPIEEETRKTGNAVKNDAKESAVPESGSSDQFVEGGGNQGTEKR
ncbi:hypothetical protein [Brasilonema sp. UFV-L1]|uniref:hypothetical protein n=1 Tax=Brasilonema sp. UFV-L1 TaxID=2234130 RepID=UPI00145D6A08|nr:hypothetical protein [Brasilonema sp. UFV-L1]NMG07544.1 hypothetical protein [Brasilonema sp. UFV-L1]